jgi:hypothetical protein
MLFLNSRQENINHRKKEIPHYEFHIAVVSREGTL